MSDLEAKTRYDPSEVEPRIVERWLESGIFHPEPEGDPSENYSIAIPLPNVTGVLHMGHALNNSVQDCLIRYHRMRGRRAKWILGTDHAGIGTQIQVERALAKDEGIEQARSSAARPSWSVCGAGATSSAARSSDSSSAWAPRSTTTTSASRSTTATPGRSRRCSSPSTEGLHLPRPLHGQLGPGDGVGDLRPRGRGPRGPGHPLLRRLPARLGLGGDHRGHRAPGDDAGRHRHRRPPRRRSLPPARGREGGPAAGRPQAEDHRRRVRQARVRHRRAQDHARATIPTTSTSATATAWPRSASSARTAA